LVSTIDIRGQGVKPGRQRTESGLNAVRRKGPFPNPAGLRARVKDNMARIYKGTLSVVTKNRPTGITRSKAAPTGERHVVRMQVS